MRYAAAMLVLVASCAEVAPAPVIPAPEAPPKPPVAVSTADPSPAPRLGLVVAEDAAAPAKSVDLVPITPLDRAFERVKIPESVGIVNAVRGRDERHVWMVSETFDWLSWDGARLTRAKAPSCPSRYDWSIGGQRQVFVYEPKYSRLTVTADEVILAGPRTEMGTRGSWANDVLARSKTGQGKWSCEVNGGIYPPVERMAGGAHLRLQVYPVAGLTIDGRRAPLPGGEGSDLLRGLDIGGRAPDDLWLWSTESKRVWHGNGVAWTERPTGPAGLYDVWIDEAGDAWVLVRMERKGVVLRWDRAANAWAKLPTDESVDASLIRGAGRDVWMVGDRHVYGWDGRTLRRGESPIDIVRDAWVGERGELWLVGMENGTRKVKHGDDEVPAGAVFRLKAAAR